MSSAVKVLAPKPEDSSGGHGGENSLLKAEFSSHTRMHACTHSQNVRTFNTKANVEVKNGK